MTNHSPSPPGNRLLAMTLAVALVGGGGLAFAGTTTHADISDAETLRVYARDFPLALAAPRWIPAGFQLVDGDGPWTELDLDQDGTFETTRAELMYAPSDHAGMAPLMMSMETQHDLSTLAGGYDPVRLANGTTAWLSTLEGNDWDGLLWNHGGLTFGIQSSGITVADMLRIAASMEFVAED